MPSTTLQLLDAWKRLKGITSDNQAALALGVQRQALSKWRNDGSHASPPLAARMAHDLGWDGLRTLAAIEADRAIDADTKKAWLRLAGKALSSALLAFAGLGAALLPAPASAASEGGSVRSSDNSVSYVRRWLRRRRVWGIYYRPAVA
jgi:transposase-like protein